MVCPRKTAYRWMHQAKMPVRRLESGTIRVDANPIPLGQGRAVLQARMSSPV
jgi:predicted site-specific integrase-resolvase